MDSGSTVWEEQERLGEEQPVKKSIVSSVNCPMDSGSTVREEQPSDEVGTDNLPPRKMAGSVFKAQVLSQVRNLELRSSKLSDLIKAALELAQEDRVLELQQKTLVREIVCGVQVVASGDVGGAPQLGTKAGAQPVDTRTREIPGATTEVPSEEAAIIEGQRGVATRTCEIPVAAITAPSEEAASGEEQRGVASVCVAI